MSNTRRKILNRLFSRHKYRYSGTPCYDPISEERASYFIEGSDCVQGGGGILEWGYDAFQVSETLAKMRADKFRFKNLKVYANPTPFTNPNLDLNKWILVD